MRMNSLAICFLTSVACLTFGCRGVGPPKGILEQQVTPANLSSRELRILLDDYVVRYATQIEETADRILAVSDDVTIRRHALLWKINGISACFQAASRGDPLAAYMDVWILDKQSIALFERQDAPALFGEWQHLAVETVHRLEEPLRQIQSTIGEDFPVREDFAIAFARDYPVNSLYFGRESVAARYTDYLDVIQAPRRELRDVMGGLDDRLDQLQRLSALYAEFLPKQARWQSELLLLESIPPDAIAKSLADLAVASSAFARMADTAESVPFLIERERAFLRSAFRDERVATLEAIDRMREATMLQLRDERVAILEALDDERVAVSQEVTTYVDRMFDSTASTMSREVDRVARTGKQVTDHVFKRAVQLLAGVALLALAAWLLLRGRFTGLRLRVRRPPSSDLTDSQVVPHPRCDDGAAA